MRNLLGVFILVFASANTYADQPVNYLLENKSPLESLSEGASFYKRWQDDSKTRESATIKNQPSQDFCAPDKVFIKQITSLIPINGNNYTCPQVNYSYGFAEEAVNTCSGLSINPALVTGNTLCSGWALVKASGDLKSVGDAWRQGKSDLKTGYGKNKSGFCQDLIKKYPDFIVK